MCSTDLTAEVRDDLLFSSQQASQSIRAWKAHQLRCIQQDKARTDVLDSLDESSVLITQDWAMKFLPRKYRETQADWFAKRGLSWHISVAVRKVRGKFQSQTFVHIVQNTSQDSDIVVKLIKHLLKELKQEHPEITSAYLRMDNAGCYHSTTMLTACQSTQQDTGITVKRVDFSDPQGGKGPCDRKAATIKGHVRRYLNEGHDVSTAVDLKEAMLSYGGIPGVRVALVRDDQKPVSSVDDKLEGISTLNNFKYDNNGKSLTVWKAYKIGKGKNMKLAQRQGKNLQSYYIIS